MSRCLMIVVLAGAAPMALAQQASFEGLGFLSMDFLEHEPESEANGVNFDGTVVVGDSDIPSKEDSDGKCYDGPQGCDEQDAPRGFRWVDGLGMVDLFGNPGEVFCCEVEPFSSRAYAVSPDGTWSAGVVYNAEEPSEAAIWSGNGSPQSLGNLGGTEPRLVAIADGGIVAAGYVKIGGDKRPVVSIGGPIEDLVPNLPNAEGEAFAVSNDGMVILGHLDLGDGSYGAVRWTYDNGYQWSFLDETNPTWADDMSSDGTVIVGRQHVDGEFKAFRHTDADGFEYIDPPEGATSLSLDLVSDDGRVIVGESDVWAGPGIWTAQTGWRELEQVLDDYGVLPIGWTLHDAEGLSGDGTTIVGEAIDPNNYNQAYRAVVPRGPQVHLLAIGIDDNGMGQGGLISPLRGDLSAFKVVNAFLDLGIPMSTEILQLEWENTVDNGPENILAMNAAIDALESQVAPGDTMIFYINTHGSFETPAGADEYELCMQVNPLNDAVCEFFDTDEYLVVGGQGDPYTDDDLRGMFAGGVWDEVDKLFIVDACFAGGFWSQGPPIFGDTGDFATLPKSAFIASSPEAAFSYSEIISGVSYLSYAIDEALDELSDDPSITFAELQQAIEDAEGYILESFTGDNGFTGMIMGYDFSEYYGLEAPAEYEPAFGQTEDSAFGLGDEEVCLADCNQDGALNILDFVCFQGLFQAQDPAADCDANGQFNILDFVCFQGLFGAGCP